MKRQYTTITLTILTLTVIYGQTEKDSCPRYTKGLFAANEDVKVDTTFHLSSGKTIALFGYKYSESNPAIFTEFVLWVCGRDTIIGYWEALRDCVLEVHQDTLFVNELINLPTGESFEFRETIGLIEKIYFCEQKVVKEFFVNRQVKKYNKKEIQAVLKRYKTVNPEICDWDDEYEIASKLFVATISGDKKARKYFKEFDSKFEVGCCGLTAVAYKKLTKMLELWDKKE
jgi:hypothetical protein